MYYDQHVCGARIQELRKSKGYTQEALAEAIDIDAKRISKIERGVISASYNDMILFSEFFGVTLDYLIIGKRQDVDALKKRVQDGCVYFTEVGLQEYIARSTHRARPKDNNPTFRKKRTARSEIRHR